MLLTAIVGVGALSIDMFLPSLPTIAAVFLADASTAQLTVTLFLAGLAVSQLVWGPLSDRFGRRRVLLAGLALYTLAGTACAFIPGIRTLIAARIAGDARRIIDQQIRLNVYRDAMRGGVIDDVDHPAVQQRIADTRE